MPGYIPNNGALFRSKANAEACAAYEKRDINNCYWDEKHNQSAHSWSGSIRQDGQLLGTIKPWASGPDYVIEVTETELDLDQLSVSELTDWRDTGCLSMGY